MITKQKHIIAYFALLVSFAIPAQATTLIYSDEATFKADLSTSVTDTYGTELGYPAGVNNPNLRLLNDTEMSAVFGQTRYIGTGAGSNFIQQHSILGHPFSPLDNKYSPIASVLLDFRQTTLGDFRGVSAVGFQVAANVVGEDNGPNYAFVTYHGGLTSSFLLPLHNPNPQAPLFQIDRNFKYWGITSSSPIQSIHLGREDGSPMSINGSFAIIDNLTIGMISPVPEPSAWIMMLIGFGIVGSVMRFRQRQSTSGNFSS